MTLLILTAAGLWWFLGDLDRHHSRHHHQPRRGRAATGATLASCLTHIARTQPGFWAALTTLAALLTAA